MIKSVKIKIEDKELIIETGKLAKQANGSTTVRIGDSVVFTAATSSSKPLENCDYMPLQVLYMAKSYAAGKFPGGFYKREGKPSTKEILVSRLVDRPLRPLFPKGFRNEIQIVPMALSADNINPPDILAIIGASAALSISDIPFNGPVGAVRVGKVDNKLLVNPTHQEIEESSFDLVVAGTKNGILMVEGSALQISENDMIQALKFAHSYIIKIVEAQEKLIKEVGEVKKMEPEMFVINESLQTEITKNVKDEINKIFSNTSLKKDRNKKMNELYEKTVNTIMENHKDIEEDDIKLQVREIFSEIEKDILRNMILKEKTRIGKRGLTDIRDIDCEVGILPRTHGSALFTRGETQSLAILTLGSVSDEQKVDDIEGENYKSFMLHYNFPSFSVGETKRLGPPSRRDIGHGMLAERALSNVIPNSEEFPYTIRIVSEIMESNGSSSMATVCSGSLALLDAGVPIKSPVAGIAMGLVMEDNKNYAVLSDILGEEDHMGDMDFKVAGTQNGITAFQMDIKTDSITFDIIEKALNQAKEGRMHILKKMNEVISEKRPDISQYAPKIEILQIPKDKIATVIGPGGSSIKDIIQQTNTDININDEGEKGIVTISGVEREGLEKAVKIIKNMTEEVEPGKTYQGKVVRLMPFGAFVDIPGGNDGLVHISEISHKRVNNVEDALKIGQKVKVKVIEIKKDGKISLSMKNAENN